MADMIVKEMSLTHTEFKRQWLRLCSQYGLAEATGDYRMGLAGGGWVEVQLKELPPRRIAAISLPVMQVKLLFDGDSCGAKDDFMVKFNLYFRKGGG